MKDKYFFILILAILPSINGHAQLYCFKEAYTLYATNQDEAFEYSIRHHVNCLDCEYNYKPDRIDEDGNILTNILEVSMLYTATEHFVLSFSKKQVPGKGTFITGKIIYANSDIDALLEFGNYYSSKANLVLAELNDSKRVKGKTFIKRFEGKNGWINVFKGSKGTQGGMSLELSEKIFINNYINHNIYI